MLVKVNQIKRSAKLVQSKSCVIYDGPSMIDGAPIIAVYLQGSQNIKTGDMSQVYILRKDIDPLQASRFGLDVSICGNCKHRGFVNPDPNGTNKQALQRSCYVTLMHGPAQVYKGFVRGIYPRIQTSELATLGQGQSIRVGAYGDPAALPKHIVSELISKADNHTSYSHQGRKADSSNSMISVDSKAQASAYHNLHNKRTFRVIPLSDYDALTQTVKLLKNEIICPASIREDITCSKCKLCNGGTIGKSIAILAHGTGKKYV